MTKFNGPSIYIPTDKNIYDALQHKKITLKHLIELLRSRGILVSEHSSKDALVEKISSMTLSYSDFTWIGQLLENSNRKSKVTHSKLSGKTTAKQIDSACKTLKTDLTSDSDDSIKVTKEGSKTTFKVTYIDYDFTKTELRQRTLKTCDIEIEHGDDEVTFKMPSDKKAEEVVKKLKSKIQDNVKNDQGDELEEVNISLESLDDVEVRSGFFDSLIRNIDGLTFDTVTNVSIFNNDKAPLDEDEYDDEGEDEDTDARLASYINKAAFDGAGVLESKEFQQLHERGFYIYRIVWTAEDTVNERKKVEFEAQFGNPSLCNEFKYCIRGVYNFNDRTGQHNITRRHPTPLEIRKYTSQLQISSEQALESAKLAFGE